MVDSDTLNVRAAGNFGVRFLGVDTPEIGFPLPSVATALVSLSDPRWEAFLSDPCRITGEPSTGR